MSVITHDLIMARKTELMSGGRRLSVIVALPTATDSTTPGVYKIKDPDPGDAPNTVATEPGNAKGGSGTDGMSWKYYSYDSAGSAYNL